VRATAAAAKPVNRRKPEAEGATLGMNAKKTTQRQGFKTSEFIVYPAHGVGRINGARLELFVITFVKDKMTLRVPTSKIASVGMRKLAETPIVKRALETLKGRARIKRTMWSRRAQEYEAKINSGDIVAIAEVVRDLFRSESQPEQSYSERQLYEAAIDRLAREVSAVQRITETEAIKEIEGMLAKGPHRGPKPEVAEAEEEAVVEDEAA
jgi:CarD family transcriptional regulator